MRFSSLAVALTLAAGTPLSSGFVVKQQQQQIFRTRDKIELHQPFSTFPEATNRQQKTHLEASLSPTSSPSSSSSKDDDDDEEGGQSSEEIEAELSSGRVLEGGKVIDFEAVKGPSRAEEALLKARWEVMAANGDYTSSSKDAILGINVDVIKEVGHELGGFATPAEIQKCGQYLRSMASGKSVFHTRGDGDGGVVVAAADFTEEDKTRCQEILRKAYEESGELTGAFAKTFYMGTMLLPESAREAIWAIYVWCRRTDEIVDAPRDNGDKEMLLDLSSWEVRLEELFQYGKVYDVYDLCLLDVRIKYPELEITPFMDMVRGMLMDVPELGQDRYENFDELHLYCYRVAGTVGLMSLPIFGVASGITYEQAREPALSLGVAFQITNILRDIGEDAVERGRIYLPREDMERFNVTEDQIFAQRVDDNYRNLMKYEIEKAKMYYERARRGVFMLAPESRLPVQSSLDAYGEILDKIKENDYDSLTTRAYVGKWEKLFILPFSWYRTLDISRTVPLPGDEPVKTL